MTKKTKKPSSRRGEPTMTSRGDGETPRKRTRKPAKLTWRDRLRNGGEKIKSALRSVWGAAFMMLAVMGLLFLAYMLHDLPDISKLGTVTKTPSITIKAQDGTIIGSYGDVYGDYIGYRRMPKALIDAVVATEDRNFFHHSGVDPIGLLRATWANVRAGHIVQGGSTITQQLAKNVFLTPDRTLKRKLQEMLLAFWLEAKFSKEEILTIYLNRVYMGAGNYGVDAASRRYFGKHVQDITLEEAALLVGLLKAPSRYAPTSNPELARKRASQVLLNMVDAELLTEEQAKAAVAQFPTAQTGRKGSAQGTYYFNDWIADQVPDFIGDLREDIVVTTTLDTAVQGLAQEVVGKVMDEHGAELNASQAALVAMLPDGAVKAMVGGRDYNKSQFNRAVQAQRQPGSAFKMFVYLAAVEAGLTPDSMVEDAPITIGKWQPKNYTGDYKGIMTAREAFAHSINTVAVYLIMQVTPKEVVTVARRLGIQSDLLATPSLALGTNEVNLLEITTGFAHLAAEGRGVIAYGITEIEDSKGKPLYRRTPSGTWVVLSARNVALMNQFLSSVVQGGTGAGANIGRPAGGKTGTTQDFRDAWFVGYTADMATGVWVGNDDNSSMKKVTGGKLPAMIWREFMSSVLKGVPVHPLLMQAGEEVLPWQDNKSQQLFAPDDAQPQNGGVNLSPSFWDKLFEGETKSEYPTQRRR